MAYIRKVKMSNGLYLALLLREAVLEEAVAKVVSCSCDNAHIGCDPKTCGNEDDGSERE